MMLTRIRVTAVALLCLTGMPQLGLAEDRGDAIRIATYNTSLFRDQDGQLIRDLESGDNEQARKIAEVIQRVRPDVLLLNEFDFDEHGRAAELFRTKYLAVAQNGCDPITFESYYTGPVNTGVPSGRDFGHNGKTTDPDDSFGFGRHPGQYGMLVLSKFPIDRKRVRSFQNFLWRDMPGALLPTDPKTGKPWYSDEDLAVFRLSSKSMWDVPINVPARGKSKAFTLHLLPSHPTPPVFDGPEDRNGKRNHDEIRLLADFIDEKKGDYLKDDIGKTGGLPTDAQFVIVGDLNCDPFDGSGLPGTMDQLLHHARVNASVTPTGEGGKLAAEQKTDLNSVGRGDPAQDTSKFGDFKNLRIDYALPSRGLEVVNAGIFWPKPGDPGADAVTATDHRSVWIDVKPKEK